VSPRTPLVVLCLAAVPLSAEVGTPPVPVLRLVWADPTNAATGSELAARGEADSLLSRMGVTVSWRRGVAGEQLQRGEIWVIFVGEGPGAGSDPIVLGATKRGAVCPAIWVRVPNIRKAIGVPRGASLSGLAGFERRLVAVAIGRVIAHEVVHAVAPSVPHGTGLTASNLTRNQLRAPTITVDAEVGLAVQASLRGNPVFASPATGVMAAQSEVPDKDR
jgi:hypothetical protein